MGNKPEVIPQGAQTSTSEAGDGSGNPETETDWFNVLGAVLGGGGTFLDTLGGILGGSSPEQNLAAANATARGGNISKSGDVTRIVEEPTNIALGEQLKTMDQLDNTNVRANMLQTTSGLNDQAQAAMMAAMNSVAAGQGGDSGIPMADALKGSSAGIAARAGTDQAIAGIKSQATQEELTRTGMRAEQADAIGNRSGEALYLQGVDNIGSEEEQAAAGGGGFWDIAMGIGGGVLDMFTGGIGGTVATELLGSLFGGEDVTQKTTGSPKQNAGPAFGLPVRRRAVAGRSGG